MEKKRKRKRLIDAKKFALVIGIGFILTAIIAANYMEVRNISFTGTYLEFQQDVKKDKIDYIRFSGSSQTVDAFLKNGDAYSFWSPRNTDFYEYITENDIEVRVRRKTIWDAVTSVAVSLPFVLIAGLIGFMMFYMVGSFTMSTTGVTVDKKIKTKFTDIGGLTSVKQEISYVIGLLEEKADPSLVLPRGIMLYGPPGTGKTLIARAVAGESNVPFIALSGSDFIDKFAGVGTAKIKRLYEVAQANSPVVIFIDEIDSIGSKRSSSDTGVSRDSNATLNALLNVMDGLLGKSRVLFIAATNRLELLDEALLRPGRFDKQIYIGPPSTIKDTGEIVELHLRGKRLREGEDRNKIYHLFRHVTGAAIESSINDAVIDSCRKGDSGELTFEYIRRAMIKSVTKSVETEHLSLELRHRTAIHEIGHTLMGLELGYSLLYVTVIASNVGINGMTMFEEPTALPITLKDGKNLVARAMAGMLAEELILGERSTFGIGDIKVIDNAMEQIKDARLVEDVDKLRHEIEQEVKCYLYQMKDSILMYADLLETHGVLYDKDFQGCKINTIENG